MIRIPRKQLNAVIATLMDCATVATDTKGMRVRFPIAVLDAERAALAALSMLYPGPGPATASDVFFTHNDGNIRHQFPPPTKEL